jgi:hypothetical protein
VRFYFEHVYVTIQMLEHIEQPDLVSIFAFQHVCALTYPAPHLNPIISNLVCAQTRVSLSGARRAAV